MKKLIVMLFLLLAACGQDHSISNPGSGCYACIASIPTASGPVDHVCWYSSADPLPSCSNSNCDYSGGIMYSIVETDTKTPCYNAHY